MLLTIGALFIGSIIDRYNRKIQLIIFLFINATALFAFPLYTQATYGLVSRIIVGMTQVRFT
jgi:predicted MFS family arabinose efflux permease